VQPLEDTVFAETQRFWSNTVLKVLLPFESLVTGGILLAVASQQPPADQVWIAVAWLALGIALPAAFLAWGMRTRVTPTRLAVRFAPFRERTIDLGSITIAEIRRTSFAETGGWGLRQSKSLGRIYNIAGDRGVALTTADGKKFYIGTQQPDALLAAVRAGMPS
jgi:hypothetical protein